MLQGKKFAVLGSVLALGLATACGGEDNNNNNNNTNNNNNNTNNNNNNNTGFQQPEGTTPLSFCIDDSANGTYEAGDGLKWKGTLLYDETTRIVENPGNWDGPYPPVYDDGPWNAGGHEPIGQTAGDHVWCVTAFFATPTEDTPFEYGAEDAAGWIWVGGNGTFTVPANSTAEIIADPLVIEAHGTIDMRLTIDTSTLAAGYQIDPATDTVKVKGSYASWVEIPCVDDGTKGDATAGDGIFTFVLSENVGVGTNLKHAGLLRTGQQAEFVFVFNEGLEYKGEVAGQGVAPLTQGVKAEISTDGTTWTDTPINYLDSNHNTYIQP
ncbi:MAG: hypothetical protein H6730_19220 [Deltaproteobacteria bacterium]|nr:hypothetical protein [Deltaproteobacteria bacterium]